MIISNCVLLNIIIWLQLGYDIDGNELNGVFARFKTIASVKKVNTIIN